MKEKIKLQVLLKITQKLYYSCFKGLSNCFRGKISCILIVKAILVSTQTNSYAEQKKIIKTDYKL